MRLRRPLSDRSIALRPWLAPSSSGVQHQRRDGTTVARGAGGNQPGGARSRIAYPISGLPVVLIGSPHPSRHALHIVAIVAVARIARVWLTGVVGRIALALVAPALE